ncbi:MAG: ribosome small subunit-dependent GTPase A [Lachnospiraceae bacterium]|nr:ribosome small subunit-dependent GTPase A [Lachnospiraceae bacterium]
MAYRGQIIKAMSGFYYVRPDREERELITSGDTGRTYQCRAKGIFRKKKISPLVGDRVMFELTETDDVEGNVTEILPRKNELIRPQVANVDQALVIFAVHTPEPALDLLDRFLLQMRIRNIPVILDFNKDDLGTEDETDRFREIYRDAGIELLFTSTVDNTGIDEVKDLLRGKLTTVAGPSGAGKSSLINRISGREVMETGSISRKIGRGKQTTRHTELIEIEDDSFIIDTPGFSSLELPDLKGKALDSLFPEIDRFRDMCFFSGCSHISEPDCNVKKKLSEGAIPRERYESYVLFYNESLKIRRYDQNR